MAPDTQGVLEEEPIESAGKSSLPPDWYDRSSLRGNFRVMIADQTREDYLRRCSETSFCTFIDGVVYMHASATDGHQLDVQQLMSLLAFFNSVRVVGLILTSPAQLRVRDGAYLEPDVFVLPLGTKSRDENDLMPDPPALLIIEVCSPSIRTHDREKKISLYREANAVEVWCVDARDQVVIFDRRTADGRESLRVSSGPIQSTRIPGFWFNVDWLWSEPRANLMRCLDQILAGPPVPG